MAHPQKATAKEWTGLAVLVLPCLLVSMDMSVLFLAVPFLSADLMPTSTQLLWILDIYGFFLAGLLVTMGALGDRIGRRRLLLAGAALFGVASVIAAFSTSAEMLIAARALLGIGGATLAPSTLALIRNLFHDPDQRRVAIAIWTAGFAGGAALGPVIGGLLLENFFWGSVFLLNVPVMVALVIAAPLLLPEHKREGEGRFDIVSALLSLLAVLPVIQGTKMLAAGELGWESVALIALGLAFGWVFVRRQRTLDDPMIDVALFANPAFSVSILANTVTIFSMLGIALYSAQFLQLVLGMSPFLAALWSLPSFAGMVAGTMTAPALVKTLRPSAVIAIGLLIGALGLGSIWFATGPLAFWVLIVGSIVLALGVGMVTALATDLIVNTAPPEQAGSASSISETGNEFGGALGIALFGSIGAAVYRSGMDDPRIDGLGTEMAEAIRSTLASAVALLDQVPGGEAFVALAHDAFVDGMRVSAVIGALILLVSAGLVARGLRNVPLAAAGSERQPHDVTA